MAQQAEVLVTGLKTELNPRTHMVEERTDFFGCPLISTHKFDPSSSKKKEMEKKKVNGLVVISTKKGRNRV